MGKKGAALATQSKFDCAVAVLYESERFADGYLENFSSENINLLIEL